MKTLTLLVSLGHIKRENLTVIITEILKELDFVMSFIQRAKSSELLKKDSKYVIMCCLVCII